MKRVPPASDYAAAIEYLYALKPTGAKFGVDRMAPFAAALGDPQQRIPFIHVAGTNGKGSVAAMLDSILRAAGWRTGLFTSPHLVNLGERVQVQREPLTSQEIVAYLRELRPVIDQLAKGNLDDRPSFFEIITAMAFLQFTRKNCDIAVLEVGLGGQLDATNIVVPEVSVITSIGRDHEEFLGEALEKIAVAKAGIIKTGRPVVVGRLPEEAECVIREIASAKNAPVISVVEEFGEDIAKYPQTSLEGDYQQWNAATATLAARALPPKWRITEEAIARGLRQVDWPGRWQRIRLGGRLAILDASHNAEGAQVLESNLSRLVEELGRRPVVITGVLGLNRAQPLIDVICRHAQEIHFVVPDQPRACTHAELTALVPGDFTGRVVRAAIDELFPAADVCTAGTANDVVVVTGSIYLLGEVLSRLASGKTPA
ncbi:MAG: folylpolyglutamate synthase/dihydrofolate synthase family protein [Opitutaceae bacterium]